MANENVKSMIDSLVDGDNVAAQDSFKNALSVNNNHSYIYKKYSIHIINPFVLSNLDDLIILL